MNNAKPIFGEDAIFGRLYYRESDYDTLEAECERLRKCLELRDSLPAAGSAVKGAAFCCENSFKAANQRAWRARDLTYCKCDHNEYCEFCWPADFRPGGKWHGGFVALQPAHVSVPRELLQDLRDLASDAVDHHRQAYAGYKLERQANMDQVIANADAILNGGEA